MKKVASIIGSLLICSLAFAATDPVLSFYQRAGVAKGNTSKQDRAFASALARSVGQWIRMNPKHAELKEALALQADYHLRAQEEAEGLINIYQVRFYFPQEQDIPTLSSNVEKAMERIDRRQKAQALKLLAVDVTGLNTLQARQAALLNHIVKSELTGIYAPVNELFETYFFQYPQDSQLDKLTLLYGDWHRQNGNFYAAIWEYKKVQELFPNSPYKAASLRLMADVYASDLKDYTTAETLYRQVLKQYPQSAERGLVYKHMAVMMENQKKYVEALENYDQAIAELGQQNAAYEAWTGKVDVLIKVKDYQAAYEVLLQGAEAFPGDETKQMALWQRAADMAANRLKNLNLQAAALEKALLAYPQTQYAPEMMYTLAANYEKQNKTTQAIELYKRLIVHYPTDKYANRAQGRIDKLEK